MNNTLHLDSKESAFFQRELEYIKSKTYDVKHKNLKATKLIPVSTEANAGADTITFRKFDAIGMAKIISDYANDFPRVDVYGAEETVKVHSIGASYGYSIKEIRRSAMAGTRLDQRRAAAARRAIDEKIDSMAWAGDSNSGAQGLISYPGIQEYTVPNDGTGATKTWSTKTPDQIVRDITGALAQVVDTTNGIEQPDTLLLPFTQYLAIANTRMTDGNDKTILTYVLENNPWIKTIEPLEDLKTAGASGTARGMVYVRDPEHLTLEIPQPFEQFEMDKKGGEYEVPCHAECAGVIVYYPTSVCFFDGI